LRDLSFDAIFEIFDGWDLALCFVGHGGRSRCLSQFGVLMRDIDLSESLGCPVRRHGSAEEYIYLLGRYTGLGVAINSVCCDVPASVATTHLTRKP
jgi:hypothetical protein